VRGTPTDTRKDAAKEGNPEVLKRARANGCEWSPLIRPFIARAM